MVERIKDAQDRFLDALFETEPVADDGFSDAVVATLKRRFWLRRLLLPTAAAIGAAIAVEPVIGLIALVKSVAATTPMEALGAATVAVAPFSLIAPGAVLLAIGVLTMQVLQE